MELALKLLPTNEKPRAVEAWYEPLLPGKAEFIPEAL